MGIVDLATSKLCVAHSASSGAQHDTYNFLSLLLTIHFLSMLHRLQSVTFHYGIKISGMYSLKWLSGFRIALGSLHCS